jgi:hypothetical protein
MSPHRALLMPTRLFQPGTTAFCAQAPLHQFSRVFVQLLVHGGRVAVWLAAQLVILGELWLT